MHSLTLSIVIGGGAISVSATAISPWTLSGTTLSYPSDSPLPVPAGSGIASIQIAPPGWNGTLTLSGPQASLFAISGTTLNVGAAVMNPGSYSVTVTARP